MLTRLVVRNFKRFREIDIELGERVVFVGPNNSGKTSALQALALWQLGARKWAVKHNGKDVPKKVPWATIGRGDPLASPHPVTNLLWYKRRTRGAMMNGGNKETGNIRIDIAVEGELQGEKWASGIEFDYANEESFYCRPIPVDSSVSEGGKLIPPEALAMDVVFLPPLSGLSSTERRQYPGAINVMLGEGRAAEVLRNLCFRLSEENPKEWDRLVNKIQSLFGVSLDRPKLYVDTSEIVLQYTEHGTSLDLSSSGRGLQQTLLILSYMHSNPGSVMLLDEPDAHLEILRQRQIYDLIGDMASESDSQIVVASHSEILLNDASEKDTVIAFVGRPHRIGGRKSQVRKALANIGYDHYLLAEQTGWVLYVEGSTDLEILRAFAKRLSHDEAIRVLERPFVHYVQNEPKAAADHFFGIMEALPHIKGVALFDSLEQDLPYHPPIEFLSWKKREIENYFCTKGTFEIFARGEARKNAQDEIFAESVLNDHTNAMRDAMKTVENAVELLEKRDPWDSSYKVSDHFIQAVLLNYYENLNQAHIMRKSSFHKLVEHVPLEDIDPEVREKLDAIVAVAESAEPMQDEI